jgi:hypothetical protein
MSLAARMLLLPSWLLLTILVVVAVGLSLAGLRLVTRRIPHHVMKSHNDVAGFIFATIGVMYGVILGFAIYMVWADFNGTKNTVALECAEILGMHQDLALYPDGQAAQGIQAQLIDYTRLVIHDEFPAMARMRNSLPTRGALNRVWISLRELQPGDGHAQIVYQEILEDMNRLEKFRLERLEAAQNELPDVMWLTMIVGAMITISFTFFFGSENTWAQVIMTALLAAMLSTMIFVVMELDHPFLGDASVKPDHYERVLEFMVATDMPGPSQ